MARKNRTRSAAYRARRKWRHAMRRVRASERNDYQIMLESTPGYWDMMLSGSRGMLSDL